MTISSSHGWVAHRGASLLSPHVLKESHRGLQHSSGGGVTVSMGGRSGHVVIEHHAVRCHSIGWGVKLGGGHVTSVRLETAPLGIVTPADASAIYLLRRVVSSGGCLRGPGRYVDAAVSVICKLAVHFDKSLFKHYVRLFFGQNSGTFINSELAEFWAKFPECFLLNYLSVSWKPWVFLKNYQISWV